MKSLRSLCLAGFPLATVFIAVLSGCATYTVPSGAPTARVRFVSNIERVSTFFVSDVSTCPDPGISVIANINGMNRGEPVAPMDGESSQPPERTIERAIQADKRIYLSAISLFATIDHTRRCGAGVMLVPKPGAQYEVRYFSDQYLTRCNVEMVEIGKDGAGSVTHSPVAELTTYPIGDVRDVCVAARKFAAGTTR
ncbi:MULTISPECIES: hypothetical protein [Cupriavidus]